MDLKIINEKQNPLFDRKEILATIIENSAPQRQEIIQALSQKYSVPFNALRVLTIKGSFGTNEFTINAPTTSGEVILMSVLGGIGQFFGPFIGSTVIVLVEDIVGAYTEYWSFIIGIIMLTIVLLFPKGILGEFAKLKRRIKMALSS